LQRKDSNPIPLFGDLAAELAHWQDRDRNQKINAMAQMASTKLRAWWMRGRMPDSLIDDNRRIK